LTCGRAEAHDGVVTIGAWLFAFFLVPEAKGKTLEEIEAHWRAGKHPRTLQQKEEGRSYEAVPVSLLPDA